LLRVLDLDLLIQQQHREHGIRVREQALPSEEVL
jgi:hypothetical protein